MMTTDNEFTNGETPEEQAQIKHRNETGNVTKDDDNLTQEQINQASGTNPVLDEPDQQKLDAADTSSREPIDGNGLREYDKEDVAESEETRREATEVAQDASPQAKQEEIAKNTQDKQNIKLNPNS